MYDYVHLPIRVYRILLQEKFNCYSNTNFYWEFNVLGNDIWLPSQTFHEPTHTLELINYTVYKLIYVNKAGA